MQIRGNYMKIHRIMVSFLSVLLSLSFFSVNNVCYALCISASSQCEEYPDITSQSAVIMESETGLVLFDKNGNDKRQVTYLVKLMTLLLVSESIENGNFTEETIQSTSNHANSMGDPQIWLNVGEKISTEELIKSIIIGNANDACVVLAEAVAGSEEAFVALMNDKAEQLSMTDTAFSNCTGIYDETQYSTAYDMALLGCELRKHSFLDKYFVTWMDDVRHGQTNIVSTNRLIRTYNGVSGMKAASSDKAGNCLVASARRSNLDLVCVLLDSSTSDNRFSEAKGLMDTAFSLNMMFEPKIDESALEPISVTKGQKLTCDVVIDGCTSVVVARGRASEIEVKIEKLDIIEAPVLPFSKVGRISYYLDNEKILEADIITKENVDRTSVKYCFVKLLDKLFNF